MTRVRRLTQILGITLIAILVWGYAIQDAGYQIPEEIEIIKAGQPRHPYQEEYEQMLYPTVRITAGWSTGTGVIIATTDRHRWTQIITAAHVVENQSVVDIELYDSSIITGTVVITDTDKDLALIRVIRVKDIYSARLAPRDYTPYLFTPVWAVGCSLGLKPRPSQGIITKIPPSPFVKGGDEGDFPYWEISAPILPGNSGGPVYAESQRSPDNFGNAYTYEVIGIAVWVKVYDGQLITTMAGVVPITEIYNFLEDYFPAKAGSKNQ